MAFIKTSDSIIIRATLTEKGKKLLARGKFKVAKFTLGDDEVDYRLFNPTKDRLTHGAYRPALENTMLIEALKDGNNNIQFGLQSFDDGILYLSPENLKTLEGNTKHAFIEFLPKLVLNTKTSYAPTLKPTTEKYHKYYLSVNDETTDLIRNNVANFNFLEANDLNKTKIVVESGILNSPADAEISESLTATKKNREKLILQKFLLDENFMVQADNRIVSGIIGIQQTSQFEYFPNGECIINFNTALRESPAISLDSGFDYFANFLIKGIPNLIFDFTTISDKKAAPISIATSIFDTDEIDGIKKAGSNNYSNLLGPRGSVVAFNAIVNSQLQVNSTGERDSRYSQFGTIDSILFNEMPTRKFDYIDTTIYIVGTTTNGRLQVPLRIVRYAGT